MSWFLTWKEPGGGSKGRCVFVNIAWTRPLTCLICLVLWLNSLLKCSLDQFWSSFLQPESEVSTTAEDCSSEVRWPHRFEVSSLCGTDFFFPLKFYVSFNVFHALNFTLIPSAFQSPSERRCSASMRKSKTWFPVFHWQHCELTGKWVPRWDDGEPNDVFEGFNLGTVIWSSSCTGSAFSFPSKPAGCWV